MDKKDSLKVELKNSDDASIKSSVIKTFIKKSEPCDTKESFYQTDQMSTFTRFSIKTGNTFRNNTVNNMNKTNKSTGNAFRDNTSNNMNKTNKTDDIRRGKIKLKSTTSVGFFPELLFKN